jgi:hypothetical protein
MCQESFIGFQSLKEYFQLLPSLLFKLNKLNQWLNKNRMRMKKSQLLLQILSRRWYLNLQHLKWSNKCLLSQQLLPQSLSSRPLSLYRSQRKMKMRRSQQPPHQSLKLSKLKKRKNQRLLPSKMMMIKNLETLQTSLMMKLAQNYYYARLIVL